MYGTSEKALMGPDFSMSPISGNLQTKLPKLYA